MSIEQRHEHGHHYIYNLLFNMEFVFYPAPLGTDAIVDAFGKAARSFILFQHRVIQ